MYVMTISFDQALGVHPLAMQMRSQRAALLSGNLVNQETPGYLPKDIKFSKVLAAEKVRVTPAYAREKSFPSIEQFIPEIKNRKVLKPMIGGNGVSPEIEQALWVKNNAEFSTASLFVKARLTDLSRAINGR